MHSNEAPAPTFHGFGKLLWAAVLYLLVHVPVSHTQDAATLRARYVALSQQLDSNPLHSPLYLESRQTSAALQGDIYALHPQPFATIGPPLQGLDHWCDILILHLYVKGCRVTQPGNLLHVDVGRRGDGLLTEAYPFEFNYRVVASGTDYQRALLYAVAGPLGTRDYRIMLEVVRLDGDRSFLHLGYSYGFGATFRIAMGGYLMTGGRNKVGFSIIGRKSSGEPSYIGGMRGVVERNTMRYYLAIEAYLGALTTPMHEQLEKRLNDWYSGVERYPRQLHDLERSEYLDMKRQEIQHQRAAGPTTISE